MLAPYILSVGYTSSKPTNPKELGNGEKKPHNLQFSKIPKEKQRQTRAAGNKAANQRRNANETPKGPEKHTPLGVQKGGFACILKKKVQTETKKSNRKGGPSKRECAFWAPGNQNLI